jgi:predicted HTH domain antitoxin
MESVALNISVPSDIFAALNETEEQFKKDLTLSAAIWFYKQQKLSLAKAASLAGYHRYDFEKILSDNAISISLLAANDVFNDVIKM